MYLFDLALTHSAVLCFVYAIYLLATCIESTSYKSIVEIEIEREEGKGKKHHWKQQNSIWKIHQSANAKRIRMIEHIIQKRYIGVAQLKLYICTKSERGR